MESFQSADAATFNRADLTHATGLGKLAAVTHTHTHTHRTAVSQEKGTCRISA